MTEEDFTGYRDELEYENKPKRGIYYARESRVSISLML